VPRRRADARSAGGLGGPGEAAGITGAGDERRHRDGLEHQTRPSATGEVSAALARRISAGDPCVVAEPAVNLPSGTEPGAPVSIEELAAVQGVARADDLDAIAADWPVDDDPEALDAYVRARRQERRSAALGSRE